MLRAIVAIHLQESNIFLQTGYLSTRTELGLVFVLF